MGMMSRVGRGCSRGGCRRRAVTTLTYVYADSVAVVGPLATFAEPHAYDLCEIHGDRLTVPNGWQVIRQERNGSEPGPSDEDLMAIAEAVREVAHPVRNATNTNSASQSQVTSPVNSQNLGRRGHLRAVRT